MLVLRSWHPSDTHCIIIAFSDGFVVGFTGAANRVADPAWADGVHLSIPFLGPRVLDREIAESDGVSHRLTWVSLIAAASMVSSDSSTSGAASPGDEAVLAGDAGKRAGESFVD
jgi:hypothetical protein